MTDVAQGSKGKTMACKASLELGRYIAENEGQELPSAVLQKTKLHVLDSLAAILSGSRLKPGRFAAAFVDGLGGRPESSVLGTELLTSAVNAALANGRAAHADDSDDSHLHSRSHLGCAVAPAALAVARAQSAQRPGAPERGGAWLRCRRAQHNRPRLRSSQDAEA